MEKEEKEEEVLNALLLLSSSSSSSTTVEGMIVVGKAYSTHHRSRWPRPANSFIDNDDLETTRRRRRKEDKGYAMSVIVGVTNIYCPSGFRRVVVVVVVVVVVGSGDERRNSQGRERPDVMTGSLDGTSMVIDTWLAQVITALDTPSLYSLGSTTFITSKVMMGLATTTTTTFESLLQQAELVMLENEDILGEGQGIRQCSMADMTMWAGETRSR